MNSEHIFNVKDSKDFEKKALEVFLYQASNCLVYKEYLSLLNCPINGINTIKNIPFLPIEFFKTHMVISGKEKHKKIFLSSGTTGIQNSKHYVSDLNIYEESFTKTFKYFFGKIKQYCVLALLPSYLERDNSSLVYMTDKLIKLTKNSNSGFYLNDFQALKDKLVMLDKNNQKTILFGVSFALQDFAERFQLKLNNCLIMETGGMKGRRKEITKEELHQILKKELGVAKIYSEYGMTELLSQAYSLGENRFHTPPWMRILIRDLYDPFTFIGDNRTGGINIIDLANINSCSFIETKDLGKNHSDNTFEVLGRFDNSDIRGCNLLISE